MGLGLAECFALAGLDVALVDATPALTGRALERLGERVRGHIDAGLLPAEALERLRTVRAADDIADAVQSADLVLEAAPESIEIKREVLAECDARAPAAAIIATIRPRCP